MCATMRKPPIKSKYTYVSPDRKHEYFVQHMACKETAGYGVFDEQGRRVDSDKPFADGCETAEEAQALLEAKAVLHGWVCQADL